jgi:dynein heavy chain
VSQTPQTLDELGESLVLWEKLNNEQTSVESRIPPLFDQFAILDKYEVPVSEEVQTQLRDLPTRWHDFQQTLIEADTMLKKNKVRWDLLSELLPRCLAITVSSCFFFFYLLS